MHCSNHNPDYANDDAKNGPSEGKFQIEKTALFTSKSFLRLSSQPTVGKLALWLRKKSVVKGIPNALLAKFFKFRPPLWASSFGSAAIEASPSPTIYPRPAMTQKRPPVEQASALAMQPRSAAHNRRLHD